MRQDAAEKPSPDDSEIPRAPAPAKIASLAPGELESRMRAVDWSHTPLGPLDTWPIEIRSAISVCLSELERAARRPSTGRKRRSAPQEAPALSPVDPVHESLRAVLDVLPEGVLISNMAGWFTLANRAAISLLGIDATNRPMPRENDEIYARLNVRRDDGTPYPAGELPLWRSLLLGEDVHGNQLQIRNLTTGRDIPILLNCAPLRDSSGAIRGSVAVFQDISPLKDLDYQKDEFLTTISHDLKNPITAISGMAQMMHQRVEHMQGADAARLRRGLETIRGSAQQMTRMLAELVDITRLQMARPLTLELAPVDLVALTERLVKVYWQTTEQHAVRLHAAQPAIVVLCDASRIERVIDNLLSNAIKFSPQGGPVTINLSTTVQDGPSRPGTVWAVLTVRDKGIGIPEEALPHIFEQFYRATNVVGRIAGSGIGLVGARRIVEQHGGTIGIASKQGAGTTVTLRLPLSGPYASPPT